MRVTIVVTHLLGTGHLARALTLGRAFGAAGEDVTVISGGGPVPHFDASGLDLVQLPPLRSDGVDFSNLLADDDAPASAAYLKDREAALIRAACAARPDVLITELFPFGRRVLKHEFLALLEAVADLPHRPLILASIRDILAPPSKPSKVTFAETVMAQHYDGVLVHSDADVVPLETSWPVSDSLAGMLHYTGFVAPPAPRTAPMRGTEIIVSAGGGSVGDTVFEAACAAAAAHVAHPWRLLVGGDASRRDRLARLAPPHVTVEAPRPEFRDMLARAHASVSMCGYNTALDVLQTGVPAVFVPFDDGGEVEQGLRAGALSALPGIGVLTQAELSGQTLGAAIAALAHAPPRAPRTAGMEGAARTVDIVRRLREGNAHED